MVAEKSVAQRLGAVLEKVTRQSGRLPDAPDFGSWLLGRAEESQRRRRIRIQIILTVFVVTPNLLGIAVVVLMVTITFPVPSIFTDAPGWLTWIVSPAYTVAALLVGIFWVTGRTVNALRWAIEERPPTVEDQRNTFLALWRLAEIHLVLWGAGTALLTTLYGLADTRFHSSLPLGRRLQRDRRLHQLLSAHRVRAAAGRRTGVGGRASAAATGRRHHGPAHDDVAARFGRPSPRHRAGRVLHIVAAEPHANPVRDRRAHPGHPSR